MQNQKIRPKQIPTTATAADITRGNFFVLDTPDTLEKLDAETLLQVTAQNALENIKNLHDKSEGYLVLDDADGAGRFPLSNLAQKKEYGCFSVEDENGNAVMAVLHGHVKTKNFDSEKMPEEYARNRKSPCFLISDEQLNAILAVVNGHIRTKYFNSATLLADFAQNKGGRFPLTIEDENGNAILAVINGCIRTKYFNPATLPAKFAQNKGGRFPLTIEDENGNAVLAVINGHIRTKYFNSAKKPDQAETFFTESKNYGKSVGVFGGSLSVNAESETAKNLWRKYLAMDVTSYGIAGAGFSSQQSTTTSIQRQVDSAGVKDVYILWASTNDFTNNREVGSYTDYTYLDNYDESKLTTQCGGINYCLKKLYEKNPLCEVYFFTGIDFFTSESGYNPFTQITNSLGYTYQDYVDAQKKCCELFSIPVLDQNSISGLNYFNYTQFFKDDNRHMKNSGYEKIAYQQLQFLANGLA